MTPEISSTLGEANWPVSNCFCKLRFNLNKRPFNNRFNSVTENTLFRHVHICAGQTDLIHHLGSVTAEP